MELFGKSQHAGLQTCLALPHGIPSPDTFGRVLARLQPQRLQECLLAWPRAVAPLTHGALVSRDGKTVQASLDRATAASPFPMLCAWCSAQGGLGMGPIKTDTQSKEITAIPALLPWLAIQGWSVTIEAMGCQTAIARQIRDHGGDSLLALKSNHKKASRAIQPYFQAHIEHHLAWRTREHFFAACDDSHGRTVRRRVWTITDLAALPELTPWLALQAVMGVETIRAAYPGATVPSAYRVSMASLIRSATVFVAMMRQHWDIANKRHGALDGTFNAARCRIRKDHAPENVVAVRHMALNLLRQAHSHHMSLRQKSLLCGLDEHSLLMVLSGAT